jgi:hypothetical protein
VLWYRIVRIRFSLARCRARGGNRKHENHCTQPKTPARLHHWLRIARTHQVGRPPLSTVPNPVKLEFRVATPLGSLPSPDGAINDCEGKYESIGKRSCVFGNVR